MLEREARRNLELIWLLQGLAPNYKSIADFRKDNAAALKATNCDFVLMCKELDLYAGQLIAIDGSFFRGNVAKHSIYTKERLAKALARVEQHIDDYLKALDQADAQVSADSVSPAPAWRKPCHLSSSERYHALRTGTPANQARVREEICPLD